MMARNGDLKAGVLEHFQRGPARLRLKIIVESIHPQNDVTILRWPAIFCKSRYIIFSRPSAKRGGRECRYLPLWRETQNAFDNVAQAGGGNEEVRHARRKRGEPRPLIDHAESVRTNWAEPAYVVVRQEFGLIRRYVDVDRALRLAGFASEAQVEGFLYIFIPPAIPQHFALE